MPDNPVYYSIPQVERILGISASEIVRLAAEGKLNLCFRVPDGITVWRIINQSPFAREHCKLGHMPSVAYLTIDTQACEELFNNLDNQVALFPVFWAGYVNNQTNALEQYKMVQYALPQNKFKEITTQKDFEIPLSQGNHWNQATIASLLCLQQGIPERINVSLKNLGVMSTNIQKYLDDESRRIDDSLLLNPFKGKHPITPYLADMYQVATTAFKNAKINGGKYPDADNIHHMLLDTDSFKPLIRSDGTINKLVKTAAQVIRPRRFEARAKRELDINDRNISQDFWLLIQTSFEVEEKLCKQQKVLKKTVSLMLQTPRPTLPDPLCTIGSASDTIKMSEKLANDSTALIFSELTTKAVLKTK